MAIFNSYVTGRSWTTSWTILKLAWKGIGDGSDVAMVQAHLLEELQKPSGQAIPPGSWMSLAMWKWTYQLTCPR